MKRKQQDKRVREIRDKIVKHYKPEMVILFGSRAYGKPRKDSDIDLFIVKRSRKHAIERIREVSDIFPNRNFSLDVIVRTPLELKRRVDEGDFFYEEILNNGIVLYERQ